MKYIFLSHVWFHQSFPHNSLCNTRFLRRLSSLLRFPFTWIFQYKKINFPFNPAPTRNFNYISSARSETFFFSFNIHQNMNFFISIIFRFVTKERLWRLLDDWNTLWDWIAVGGGSWWTGRKWSRWWKSRNIEKETFRPFPIQALAALCIISSFFLPLITLFCAEWDISTEKFCKLWYFFSQFDHY